MEKREDDGEEEKEEEEEGFPGSCGSRRGRLVPLLPPPLPLSSREALVDAVVDKLGVDEARRLAVLVVVVI